jgi:cytochrome c biogenesis protein ResB
VARGGQQVAASFPIQVNHPLRLGGLTVYQSSWETEGTIKLTDQGRAVEATTGQGFQDGDSFWYFADTLQEDKGRTAVFQEYKANKLVSSRTLGPGERIGPFTVVSVSTREVSGLKVVKDPGLAPFLVALFLILAGLCLTFIQKRGDAVA